ncbi:MAG TPA: NAD-dependent epimerase/dehydratase family protein [Pyrinomonadaceae bacterium]|nr:NAD-dependent epimerase/dehydratase family protein [Pyrinomonadaceae bacterium]
MEQRQKILVTGGNGFIGSRVVRLLVDRGYAVRCLLRKTSDCTRIDDLPFERVYGDVRNHSSIKESMTGCDGCIHLAAIVAWNLMDSPVLEETIVEGTRNVLEAAATVSGMRMVYVSSSVAINASHKPQVFDESSPFELLGTRMRYAIAKHKAEQLVLEYVKSGLDAVIVNPAEVYGPNDTSMTTACNIRDFLKNYPCIACVGGTAITHVDDVADGIVKALERGTRGERYILGGDNLTIEELARLTLDIAGQKKPVLRIPNQLLVGFVNLLAWLHLPSPVVPGVLDYATRFSFMDSSKAKKEFGYAPRPARQVLTPVVEWLQNSGHV